MNKTNLITFLSLAVLVILLPVYAWQEPDRMAAAQADLQQQYVSEAAYIYAENCALCHGAAGEGIGAMPALNMVALRTADYDFLYKTIARGRYNTVMSAWLDSEGGPLNEYEVNELVALMRYAEWAEVGAITTAAGFEPPTMPVPEVDDAFIAEISALDPAASAWAAGMTLYARNCTVCHGVNGEGSDLGLPLNTVEIRESATTNLTRIINEGIPATLMTGWSNVLSPEEVADIVAFLQNWDEINNAGIALTAPEPVEIDLSDPEQVMLAGEHIYNSSCMVCHGENGSGGTGPVLNSQQILTRNTDDQLTATIINGGHRPNTSMPAFGDRLSTSEIEALVQFIRAWEPTAPNVANPRGTDQGGGPPWLRSDADGTTTFTPQGNGQGNQGQGNQGQGNQGQGNQGQGNQGQGNQGQGGPPWGENDTTGNGGTAVPPAPDSGMQPGPTVTFIGTVVSIEGNLLTFRSSSDNVEREAMLGPPFFWEANAIPLNIGDVITLEGFESAAHMELNWIRNETNGAELILRKEDGMPIWTQ